jgi:uncharacterized BrkB/YihY/UPF0761 family membrane protein
LALFSASGGVNNLITAVNAAYDEEDNRNPIKKRLLALTLGAIVAMRSDWWPSSQRCCRRCSVTIR